MKTPVVVIAEARYRDWLRARLGGRFEPAFLAAEALDHQPAQLANAGLVLVQMDGPALHEHARLIERLGERQPELPVIALGSDQQPEAMLAAMRAGARDFLVPGRDDATVVTQLERVLRRGTPGLPGHGQVVAVLSGHCNPGTAFLAEHLALDAVEHFARSDAVLLLDLAQPAAAAAVFLNAQQDYSALNAIEDGYRCDQTLVDSAFGRHASGLYVLSLPENHVGPLRLAPGDLAALLDVLRGLFRLVVVTLDAALGLENLQVAVERSRHSLLLGDQTILSSRYHQTLLRELRQAACPLERAGLVVERYQRKLGLEPEELAARLQLPLMAVLGGEGLLRVQAMNTGEPLFGIAPRDAYALGVRRLAQQLFDRRATSAEPPARRGLLERLIG